MVSSSVLAVQSKAYNIAIEIQPENQIINQNFNVTCENANRLNRFMRQSVWCIQNDKLEILKL